MVNFTFQRVNYNNKRGWFATRYIAGGYAGKQFGRTKKLAMQAFECDYGELIEIERHKTRGLGPLQFGD